MGFAGPVGLIHGAPPMQARTQEGVALQLARRNRHMDVVVTGAWGYGSRGHPEQ
jgi:hypothetical protein